jgi:8-oxo-dGTP pyrophosphatase MutT (NUDIX family)
MKARRYNSAGGVVIDGGRMLLLNRPSRGEVRLPKGHIDPGETAEMAALRETTEESGYLDLEIVDDLGECVVEFEYDGNRYVRDEQYFLMRLLSTHEVERDAKDAEQFEILWEPLESAAEQLTYEAERNVARLAVARVRSGTAAV